jgi:hypothetical protein
VIHNAVIHINGEQPLLCDLYDMPATGDVSLVCTNLRTMNGTRPVFADHTGSLFVFPYSIIRFIEVPPSAQGLPALGEGGTAAAGAAEASSNGHDAEPADDPDAEVEFDEDFLRRIREI